MTLAGGPLGAIGLAGSSAGTALCQDLQTGDIAYRNGVCYACGWYNQAIRHTRSSREDLEREMITDSASMLTVCNATIASGATPPASSIEVEDDGAVIVIVQTSSGALTYRCRDVWASTPFAQL